MGSGKTPAMLEIEQRQGGRDIREIVAETYRQHGTLRKTAAALGTSHSLIWDVIERFGGRYDRSLVFPNDAA